MTKDMENSKEFSDSSAPSFTGKTDVQESKATESKSLD